MCPILVFYRGGGGMSLRKVQEMGWSSRLYCTFEKGGHK